MPHIYSFNQFIYFARKFKICSLMNDFVLENSADHDEMQPYSAFHLGLQCLPRYPLWGFPWGRESWLLYFNDFLMLCGCWCFLSPRHAVGWSAVCHDGIFCSCSLTFQRVKVFHLFHQDLHLASWKISYYMYLIVFLYVLNAVTLYK